MINDKKLMRLIEKNWTAHDRNGCAPPCQLIDGEPWVGDGFTLWRPQTAEVVLREKVAEIAAKYGYTIEFGASVSNIVEQELTRDTVEVVATNLLIEHSRHDKKKPPSRLMVSECGQMAWLLDSTFFEPIEDMINWTWKSHGPTYPVSGWYLDSMRVIMMPVVMNAANYTSLAPAWLELSKGRGINPR